jgi:hypothetical protein
MDTLTMDGTVAVASVFRVEHLEATDVIIHAPVGSTNVGTIAFSIINGTLLIDGAGCTVNINKSSLPLGFNETTDVINGAILNIYDEDLTVNQIAGINGALTGLSAANVVVDTSTMNSTLSGYTPSSRTVNGHALTSNVSIEAGDLPPSGTKLNHALLPTLVSGDLPNPAAIDITGRSANLSLTTGAIPDGWQAQSQIPGDNTNKLATTKHVKDYVGSIASYANGLATLDSSGKVPASQIDLGALGALSYQGTWDATSGLPGSPTNGKFWIINVAGDITLPPLTHFNVGDWLIYNGTWERVPGTDIGAYLSTWTGNTSISSVGTITVGQWTGDAIGSNYGGAGSVSGVLKANGSGVVSAATHTSAGDYVAPDDSTDLLGVKNFVNGATCLTEALGTSSSRIATTQFVQQNANIPQSNVVFVSAAGSDTKTGLTPNDAVHSLGKAIQLINVAGDASSSHQYAIVCLDGQDNPTYLASPNIIIPAYVSIIAHDVMVSGTVQLIANSAVFLREIQNQVTLNGGSSSSRVSINCRNLSGLLTMNSSQGICYVNVDNTSGGMTVYGPDSTLHINSKMASGTVTASGAGTTIHLDQCCDITGITPSIVSGGVIYYPTQGAGNVNGILKCNGLGTVSQAQAGTDYLTSNQSITLSGAVSGSGTTSIVTSISDGSLVFSKLANLAANSVLGNNSGSPAVPAAVSMTADANANSVLYRDASANAKINHLTENFRTQVTTGGVTLLTTSSNAIQEFTGTVPGHSVRLPQIVLGVPSNGFKYKVINSSTQVLNVQYDSGASLNNQYPGQACDYTLADNGSSDGTWTKSASNAMMDLTGAITAYGRPTPGNPVSTTLSSGIVTWGVGGNLATTLSAGYVLGNDGTITAAPTAVQMTAAPVANSIVQRDSNGNIFCNIAASGHEIVDALITSSPKILTAANKPVEEFINVTTYTVKLPSAISLGYSGAKITLMNKNTGNLTVNDAAGALLRTMASGTNTEFICTDTSSVAGAWSYLIYASGSSVMTSPFTLYSPTDLNYNETISVTKDTTNNISAFTITANPTTAHEMFLDPPVWNDLEIVLISTTSTALTLRTLVTIDTVAIQQPCWRTAGTQAWMPFTKQLPHNWKPNSSVSPHLHVVPLVTTVGAASFQLIWQIRDIGEVYQTTALPATNSYRQTATLPGSVPALTHALIGFGSQTPTGFNMNSRSHIIIGALRRITSPNDLDIYLIGFDFHIQLWKVGGDRGPY